MRSLGNVSVHSILETFPLCSLLREIFVILFFVNSGAVFGLASVTFLRSCPSEVCEVRASAFDVSAHDSRLFFEPRLGSRLWQLAWLKWKALSGVIVFCSLSRHFSLRVPLFTLKDYKWVVGSFREKTKQTENR